MSQRSMSRSHSFPIAWLGFGFSVVKAVIWNSYKNIRWMEVDITRRADTLLRTICQTRADVISIHQARWTFLLSVARGFCDWSAIRCKNLAKERERKREISAWANGYYCLAPDWRGLHTKNVFQLRYSLANERIAGESDGIIDSLGDIVHFRPLRSSNRSHSFDIVGLLFIRNYCNRLGERISKKLEVFVAFLVPL